MDDLTEKLALNRPPYIRQDTRPAKGPKTLHPTPFIPSVPLAVIKMCALRECEVVIPLLLAIHRQLKMANREWIPLNKAVWASAGDPSERKRERILRVLKAQPELVQIRQRRTATSHYEVAYGVAWSALDVQ